MYVHLDAYRSIPDTYNHQINHHQRWSHCSSLRWGQQGRSAIPSRVARHTIVPSKIPVPKTDRMSTEIAFPVCACACVRTCVHARVYMNTPANTSHVLPHSFETGTLNFS